MIVACGSGAYPEPISKHTDLEKFLAVIFISFLSVFRYIML